MINFKKIMNKKKKSNTYLKSTHRKAEKSVLFISVHSDLTCVSQNSMLKTPKIIKEENRNHYLGEKDSGLLSEFFPAFYRS